MPDHTRIDAAICAAQVACRHERLIQDGPYAGCCWWCGARPNARRALYGSEIAGRAGAAWEAARRARAPG